MPTQATFPQVSVLGESGFLFSLVFLTLFHFWMAVALPPTEDELYYWVWSTQLQGSYFDHPPLVAYLIAFSTKIFGDTIFGIRFFACLSSIAVLVTISRFAPGKDLLNLILFTPIFLLGAVLMTPDIPLLLFWSFYVFWLTGVTEVLSHWHADPVTRVYRQKPIGLPYWALGGLVLGLGGLSKYTMVIAVPCTFLVLIATAHARAWILGFAVHLLTAGIVCLPVFIFNYRHDFGPFLFQWQHSMSGTGFSFKTWFNFLGSQILLIGALPFLMLPWVIGCRKELCNTAKLRVCFFFFVVPLAFFFYKAFRSNLEANWALVAYLTFWPLGQTLLARNSFKQAARVMVVISFLTPWVASALLIVHAYHPLKYIEPAHDRLGDLKAKQGLSEKVAADIRAQSISETVFCPTYQWTSWFRFRKVASEQLFPESRKSHFTMPALDPCKNPSALVWEESGNDRVVLKCFSKRTVLGEYPLEVRGQRVATYLLTRYSR